MYPPPQLCAGLKTLLRLTDSLEVQEKVNLDKKVPSRVRLFKQEEVEKMFGLAAWQRTHWVTQGSVRL